MHTAGYGFLMKPEKSAGCHQTLSSRVGSGDETRLFPEHLLGYEIIQEWPGNEADCFQLLLVLSKGVFESC